METQWLLPCWSKSCTYGSMKIPDMQPSGSCYGVKKNSTFHVQCVWTLCGPRSAAWQQSCCLCCHHACPPKSNSSGGTEGAWQQGEKNAHSSPQSLNRQHPYWTSPGERGGGGGAHVFNSEGLKSDASMGQFTLQAPAVFWSGKQKRSESKSFQSACRILSKHYFFVIVQMDSFKNDIYIPNKSSRRQPHAPHPARPTAPKYNHISKGQESVSKLKFLCLHAAQQ